MFNFLKDFKYDWNSWSLERKLREVLFVSNSQKRQGILNELKKLIGNIRMNFKDDDQDGERVFDLIVAAYHHMTADGVSEICSGGSSKKRNVG